MADQLSNNRNWYTELASLPIYTSAEFLSDKVARVTCQIKDHVRNAKRTYNKTLVIQSSSEDVLAVATASQEVSSDVILSTTSSSGKLTAILRETASNGDKKRFVEIWAGERLEASTEVSKQHKAFYSDDQLSSLSFSPSETALVYTAEANPPESNDSDPFARFRFVPDFGEGYTGKRRPTLFLARWQAASGPSSPGSIVVRALSIPETNTTVFFGQAVFSTEDTLIATGYAYSADGKLLGIKGCWNRPTAVWELTLEPTAPSGSSDTAITVYSLSKLSDTSRSSRTPRVYRDPTSGHSTLYYLSHELGGPHATCSALRAVDLQKKNDKIIFPVVDKSRLDQLNGFAGLYSGLIPRPFLRFGGKLYLISQAVEGSSLTIVLVDTENTPSVRRLTSPVDGNALWSWVLLATDGEKRILAARSGPSVPHQLVLGRLQDTPSGPTVDWHVVDKPELPAYVEEALESVKSSIIPVPDRYPVETIVIESKAPASPPPLLTFIHGGPHGASNTAFTPSLTALALEGYTLSLPNYTGSVGWGDFYVKKLIGKCGTLDVEDVMATVNVLVKSGKAALGPGKQLIMGGSHGGFLGAHLVGQYPDIFSAAVLRNPVISSQPASTDIPDWYFYEFGIVPSLDSEQMPPELYAQLYPTSPIAYVQEVRAPVLLMLGLDDRRVVNVQGKAFYHALKLRGKEVEMLVFEGEGHPLDGVEAARVGWEASVAFFEKARYQPQVAPSAAKLG
ncbi:alpha/beta-hydrolase [Auriscalpium vulgare]|uniref:Alpha/beta-hydrolase n=1 Tax=Auriscalpium vulgare TaxID=40419 RepID=A0ACB8RD25_9AGAM|nr:alpha/beta-hydrolase [Auriscalpium vulgare]